MPRVLNFYSYFLIAFCLTALTGLISRIYTQIYIWYWVFFIGFLLTLIGLGSFYGRKAYTGLLNTSEAVMFGILILLFIGCILGGIASHV